MDLLRQMDKILHHIIERVVKTNQLHNDKKLRKDLLNRCIFDNHMFHKHLK